MTLGMLLWCVQVLAASPGEDSSRSGEVKTTIRLLLQDSLSSRPGGIPYRALRRPRVALVLSGGGARGASQVGVLKVLERQNIPIDFIAATSMGAIVGGLYASGYTSVQIESLALYTNWDEVLSLTDETKRTELFVDQKMTDERSFVAIRFQGFEPVIPSAVSSGQRLTDFLSNKVLQSLYHPYANFNSLKIPFRAVATDLVSGERVVLKDGSLAEALRGSATVPLLFNPIEKGPFHLVDGGLVDNIPADVALDEGCDFIIVVNSTSGLRNPDEMKAPWQTADQIMGIMMRAVNEVQIQKADVVITPEIGRHLSSDFHGLDTLIKAGELSARQKMAELLRLYHEKEVALSREPDSAMVYHNVTVKRPGEIMSDSLWEIVQKQVKHGTMTGWDIREHLEAMYAMGEMQDISATVVIDSASTRITYTPVFNPRVDSIQFIGCRLVAPDDLRPFVLPLIGRPLNHRRWTGTAEDLLRVYRARGYSLARVDSAAFDAGTGVLRVTINEGIIEKIDVQGGVRTQDWFVLREFPLREGDVFQFEKAKRGITNINSTTLFEYVYLEVSNASEHPALTIRLKERPSQLMRLGVRADNERNLQGLLDIRDENFQGGGTELGLTIAGGGRNSDIVLEYKAHRLFDTYLTFNVSAFHRTQDSYTYADAPNQPENHWDRERTGEYRDIRYGASLTFGSQLERLGNATVSLVLENVRLVSLENAQHLEERYQLGMIRAGTIVDTKDSYPFPKAGVGLNLSYEFAFKALGGDNGYNALRFTYESYATIANRLTFHPKVTMGFADKTMPLSQQFSLGGQDSFFGLRENDRRGREMLLLNLEYRYQLPIRLLFDTYVMARYDVGTLSTVPEEIKFSTLRHGIGAEIALDTPVGPATFGAGKSFFLGRDLPNNPVQQGPLLLYFMIGYQL